MRIFIFWLIGLSLNIQMLGAANAAIPYQLPPEASAVSKQYAAAFRAASDSIDLVHFDVDARAEALDYDVTAAATFVTNNISYDPYIGVLRGPEGTLSTEAGSAWDQAVTLSALINAMGGESMIVEGALSSEDAQRLILQRFRAKTPVSQPVVAKTIAEAMRGYAPQAAIDAALKPRAQADEAGKSTDTIIDTAAKALIAAVETAGTALPAKASAAQFITQIADDYAWVQYRDTPNDPWTTVHPAFGNASAPKVTPVRYIADTVPPEKLHRIRIALEIERFQKGKIVREAIMTPYDRPAANQAGKQISLGIGPNDQITEADDEAGFFLPLLDGQLPAGAKAFTLLGLTAPAADALAGPGIFATVANRFGGALGGLEPRKEGVAPTIGLAGTVLTVSHIAPGGKETHAQRQISDFRPDAPKTTSSMSAAVVFDGVIDVDVGAENKARDYRNLFDANAKRASQLPLYVAISTGALSVEDYLGQDIDPVTDQSWADITLFDDIFSPQTQGNEAVVRQGPFITMRRMQQSAGDNGQLQTVMDILHHQTLGVAATGGAVSLAPRAALKQGVRESVMEGVLIAKDASQSWVNARVGKALNSKAALDAFIAQSNVRETLAQRLRADFEQSGILMMSEASGALRWWRVSATTGETLGMGYEGGSELTEEAQLLTGVVGLIIAGIFAVKGAKSCVDTYSANPKMELCCHAGNAMLFLGGVASGVKAGNALGGAMKDAAMAGLGYFTAMMTWEFTVDAAAATVGSGISDAICAKIVQ